MEQLKNVRTKTIVLCAGNDGITTNTKTAVLAAIEKWQHQGYQVKIAMPFDDDLSKKFDFNDLLKKQSEQAIN